MFDVFVRNWWKRNPRWPNGREPNPGARKTYLARNVPTEEEARRICQEYNRTHEPGKLGRKAEYRRK